MSKFMNALLAAAALTFAPAVASAEISIADALDEDNVLTMDADATDSDIAHPAHRRGPGPGPAPRGHVVHHEVRHYHTNVRPRVVQPVVVVERPATVVVSDSQPVSEPVARSYSEGSKFGLGIRGSLFKQSPIQLYDGTCLETNLNGGLGYYIKLRPVRWISLEFINDFIFGEFEKELVDSSGYEIKNSYVKIPVSHGLRLHFLDYGPIDLYGVAAASLTFNSLSGSFGVEDDRYFTQFGGQAGGGFSFVASGFEIGVDLRYTIDEAPDSSVYGRNAVDQESPIHGVLFSVNIGYAL